jgi:hypothetical protein
VIGIELSITFKEQVSLAGDGLNPVSSVLITLPPGYINRAQVDADIVQTGDQNLIIQSVDFTHQTYIVINLNRAALYLPGTYGFRFPVLSPSQTPSFNIWKLSLCAADGECSSPDSDGVIVTFPYMGFAMGATNPLTAVLVTNDAGRMLQTTLALAIAFFSLIIV